MSDAKSTDDTAQENLPQRDPGATLEPPDRERLLSNREAIQAGYDEQK